MLSLDVLRGLAMVGVVAVHTLRPRAGGLPLVPWALIANGARGVQLFFVVSVVLALRSLERRAAAGDTSATRYWFRRWLRLAPLFYLALAAWLVRYAVVPRGWRPSAPPIDVPNVVAHLAFLHALSPWWINSIMGIEWALGILALFYLAAPWLARLGRSPGLATAAFALTAVVGVGATLALDRTDPIGNAYLWHDFLGISPLAQAPVLMAGVVAFACDRAVRGMPRGRIARLSAFGGGVVVAGLMATGLVPVPKVVLVLLFGVAFAAVAFAVMGLPSPGGLVATAAAWLGKRTYGVYLFHLFVLAALVWAVPRLTGLPDTLALRFALLPLVLLSSGLVAEALERVVERPVVAWAERGGGKARRAG
jgi:peptidoglycan/LPS O-acetylase OafA/YrhL